MNDKVVAERLGMREGGRAYELARRARIKEKAAYLQRSDGHIIEGRRDLVKMMMLVEPAVDAWDMH